VPIYLSPTPSLKIKPCILFVRGGRKPDVGNQQCEINCFQKTEKSYKYTNHNRENGHKCKRGAYDRTEKNAKSNCY
jgi:hypothetical protein